MDNNIPKLSHRKLAIRWFAALAMVAFAIGVIQYPSALTIGGFIGSIVVFLKAFD